MYYCDLLALEHCPLDWTRMGTYQKKGIYSCFLPFQENLYRDITFVDLLMSLVEYRDICFFMGRCVSIHTNRIVPTKVAVKCKTLHIKEVRKPGVFEHV